MRLADLFPSIMEATKPVPVSSVQATAMFRKEIAVAPERVKNALKDFIETKKQDSTQRFGLKDWPFTGGGPAAKQFWHCHLVHGKVVVIYRIVSGVLYLYKLSDHDGASMGSGHQFTTMGNSELGAFSLDDDQKIEITKAVKQDVNQLFYEMAVDGAGGNTVLRKAVSGDFSELQEFIVLTCQMYDEYAAFDEDLLFQAVVEAMGGPERLREVIQSVMGHLGS